MAKKKGGGKAKKRTIKTDKKSSATVKPEQTLEVKQENEFVKLATKMPSSIGDASDPEIFSFLKDRHNIDIARLVYSKIINFEIPQNLADEKTKCKEIAGSLSNLVNNPNFIEAATDKNKWLKCSSYPELTISDFEGLLLKRTLKKVNDPEFEKSLFAKLNKRLQGNWKDKDINAQYSYLSLHELGFLNDNLCTLTQVSTIKKVKNESTSFSQDFLKTVSRLKAIPRTRDTKSHQLLSSILDEQTINTLGAKETTLTNEFISKIFGKTVTKDNSQKYYDVAASLKDGLEDFNYVRQNAPNNPQELQKYYKELKSATTKQNRTPLERPPIIHRAIEQDQFSSLQERVDTDNHDYYIKKRAESHEMIRILQDENEGYYCEEDMDKCVYLAMSRGEIQATLPYFSNTEQSRNKILESFLKHLSSGTLNLRYTPRVTTRDIINKVSNNLKSFSEYYRKFGIEILSGAKIPRNLIGIDADITEFFLSNGATFEDSFNPDSLQSQDDLEQQYQDLRINAEYDDFFYEIWPDKNQPQNREPVDNIDASKEMLDAIEKKDFVGYFLENGYIESGLEDLLIKKHDLIPYDAIKFMMENLDRKDSQGLTLKVFLKNRPVAAASLSQSHTMYKIKICKQSALYFENKNSTPAQYQEHLLLTKLITILRYGNVEILKQELEVAPRSLILRAIAQQLSDTRRPLSSSIALYLVENHESFHEIFTNADLIKKFCMKLMPTISQRSQMSTQETLTLRGDRDNLKILIEGEVEIFTHLEKFLDNTKIYAAQQAESAPESYYDQLTDINKDFNSEKHFRVMLLVNKINHLHPAQEINEIIDLLFAQLQKNCDDFEVQKIRLLEYLCNKVPDLPSASVIHAIEESGLSSDKIIDVNIMQGGFFDKRYGKSDIIKFQNSENFVEIARFLFENANDPTTEKFVNLLVEISDLYRDLPMEEILTGKKAENGTYFKERGLAFNKAREILAQYKLSFQIKQLEKNIAEVSEEVEVLEKLEEALETIPKAEQKLKIQAESATLKTPPKANPETPPEIVITPLLNKVIENAVAQVENRRENAALQAENNKKADDFREKKLATNSIHEWKSSVTRIKSQRQEARNNLNQTLSKLPRLLQEAKSRNERHYNLTGQCDQRLYQHGDNTLAIIAQESPPTEEIINESKERHGQLINELHSLRKEGSDLMWQNQESFKTYCADISQKARDLKANNADENSYVFSLFLTAIGRGDAMIIQALIDGDLNINCTDKDGYTPIYVAAMANQPNLVNLFAQNNVLLNINVLNPQGSEINAFSDLLSNPDRREIVFGNLMLGGITPESIYSILIKNDDSLDDLNFVNKIAHTLQYEKLTFNSSLRKARLEKLDQLRNNDVMKVIEVCENLTQDLQGITEEEVSFVFNECRFDETSYKNIKSMFLDNGVRSDHVKEELHEILYPDNAQQKVKLPYSEVAEEELSKEFWDNKEQEIKVKIEQLRSKSQESTIMPRPKPSPTIQKRVSETEEQHPPLQVTTGRSAARN